MNRCSLRVGRSAVLLLVVLPVVALSQVTIDDFTVGQTATGTVTDAAILGGERDLEEISGANATVGSGIARCQADFLQACQVIYDGVDGNAAADQQPGFTSTDFTAGGVTSFDFPFTLTAGNCNVQVSFCDSVPNCENVSMLVNTPGSTTLSYPHSGFSTVSFTDITFLYITMAPQTNSSDCHLGVLTTPVELMEFEVQ